MRTVVFFLILLLAIMPAFAETIEVSSLVTQQSLGTPETSSRNFWQEFDIAFWQTLPFAALWGHFIDRQLSQHMSIGSEPHWNAILTFAALVSAGNGFIHARRVVKTTELLK